MVIVEKLVEWRLAGETEVVGENLPQRHFVHHKFHMIRPRGKAAGAGNWPLTSNKCRGQENVDLYIHSPTFMA
jgi:hypothetical protein